MATTRPRHMITETDEIAGAMRDAAIRWPGSTPVELLRHLVAEGHAALRARKAAELAAIEESAGLFTGMYPPGYLEDLRNDWPE